MPVVLCEICAKGFADNTKLRRHQQSVHQGAKFACEKCGRNFNRKDNKDRHTKTCSKSKLESFPIDGHPQAAREKRSSADNGRSEARQPKRRRVEMPQVEDPELKKIFEKNWRSMRTWKKEGKVHSRYNFFLETSLADLRNTIQETVFNPQIHRFKVNFSFGFILRHRVDRTLRYFHASQGHDRVLPQPRLINNLDDFSTFLDVVMGYDNLEFAKNARPDSAWVVESITNVTFFVNLLLGFPIGCGIELPDFVVNNEGLFALQNKHWNGEMYRDNFCLFRCLAMHRGCAPNNLETPTKAMVSRYCNHFGLSDSNFPGVSLFDLCKVENLFGINIFVYKLDLVDGVASAQIVQRSLKKHPETMYVNLYENHFSYIANLNKYCKTYLCKNCGKLWKGSYYLNRHVLNCDEKVKHKFVGGAFHPPSTVFEQLASEGIVVPDTDRFMPYRAVFDFECFFDTSHLPEGGPQLEWVAKHVPASVSVCSNVPGFQQPKCFISTGDSGELIKKQISYLEEISASSYQILRNKYQYVFDRVSALRDTRMVTEEQAGVQVEQSKHPLTLLLEKLDEFLHELPVLGFNSGRYDINLAKIDLVEILRPHLKFVVKSNNKFMCLKTPTLKFLDIVNYIAPGFSYDKFIKAYGVAQTKFFFPYEWLTSLDKLKETSLPPIEAFFSSLTSSTISQSDYDFCLRVWQAEKMETMQDFLVYYNNLDVVPFLEAIDKAFGFYQMRGLDMFRQGISVPGLTLIFLHRTMESGAYFSSIDDKNQDLFWAVKENLVGGPSIIFHRYHEKGVTYLREQELSEPKLCQGLVGYDANALYLSCLMKDLPTRYYIRYKESENFVPRMAEKFGYTAMEWLEWEARESGNFIQHKFNLGEKQIGYRKLPVDGFCQSTQTIFQFHGCYFHGHDCHLTRDWATGEPAETNRCNGKSMAELGENTQKITDYFRALGYRVAEMWECQWRRLKSSNPTIQAFIDRSVKSIKPLRGMTQEKLLAAVLREEIFGLVLCDIHTPDSLKPHFSEFCPVFKNVEVSKDDIGDVMKEFAEENNLMGKPRRMLIGSFFGNKILLITPLLKWYVEHGLVVTKIYEVAQFTPKACFKQFGEQVSEARRSGDVDPDKAIIGETWKLLGNSGYGRLIMNKQKHRNVSYVEEEKTQSLINEPLFHKLDQLKDDLYEVEMFKKKIVFDLPIHVGFFVYNYAKLRMLEFYYDCLDHFVDRKDFQGLEMDTDSFYFALSAGSLEDIIKLDKRREFFENYDSWFPAVACHQHQEEFVETRIMGQAFTPRPCCIVRQKFDKRTPGLFKTEWEGDGFVGLCSKTYFCFGAKNKQVSKGLSIRQNVLSKETYQNVIQNQSSAGGVNTSFRVRDHQIFTYKQGKKALSYFYPKRKVLADRVSTIPLDI